MSFRLLRRLTARDAAEEWRPSGRRPTSPSLRSALAVAEQAETEEELAQQRLRKAYEDLYLDARKAYGRAFAERLLPKLSVLHTSPEDASDEVS